MISSFSLGPITITFYSLFILTGMILAAILIIKESKKYGIDTSFVTNLIFWCIIFGIIGARIYYVLFNLDYYLSSPIEIIKVWNGGLAIHGGIVAGLITLIIYCNKYKINFLKMADIMVPGLVLGQAIGRWGNFFNMEAHGGIVSRGFLESIHIPKFIINGMHIGNYYYHPTFLYESIFCILCFILLLVLRKLKKLNIGTITSVYLIWYGILRFFIEGLRTDSLMFFNLKIAQIISLVMVIFGIILLIYSLIKNKKYHDTKEAEYE